MMDPIREMEEDKKRQEEERIRSEKRRKHREAAQTEVVHTTLVRGERGFGLGIAEADSHCLVHRLVRTQYHEEDEESSPDSKKTPNKKLQRLKLGDRIVKVGDKATPAFQEALDAIKATPELLVLELLRDPEYPDQREWVRDRLWNYSIAYYRAVQAGLIVAGIAVFGLLVWLALQEPERPRSPFDAEYQDEL